MKIQSNIKDINGNIIKDNHIVGLDLMPGLADKVVAIVYIRDNVFYTRFIDSRVGDMAMCGYSDRLAIWSNNDVPMEILGTYKVNMDGIVLEYREHIYV